MKPVLAIGLMSGTSLDGVDAALVDFSGRQPVVRATHFAEFDGALRTELLALQASAPDEIERAAIAANGLAQAYAAGVREVLRASGLEASAVRTIGAHGQTVRHRPESGFTIQLNNPALLAEMTGIAVVADFRSRDVAAGGQGAPLAPAFHQAFFSAPGRARAVVNIGGIANVTVLAACRTWGVESENRPQRGQFLPHSQSLRPAIGQEGGEKWTAAADLQPTLPKSDRLLD